MTSPKPAAEVEPSSPQTPRKKTPPNDTPTKTPERKVSTPDGGGKAPATARRRAATTKNPPTLLSDFLLGRPSPARVAADKAAAREAARQRRESLELVKQEMRQAAVQQVQAPGGVRDRVKKWQMTNAEALDRADPLAAPTEPSEVNIHVEEESVTEQDRVRIKTRRKKVSAAEVVVVVESSSTDCDAEKENSEDRSSSPPKKRVVSDTNWVKNQKKKSPPRKRSPKGKTNGTTGGTPPKQFVLRPGTSPAVSNKIKEWAAKVEVVDQPPQRSSASRSVGSGGGRSERIAPTESDVTSERSGSTRILVESTESRNSNRSQDEGVRVRPVRPKTYHDDGIRIRPQKTSLPDDGIRIRPGRPVSADASTVRTSSRLTSRTPSTSRTATQRDLSPSERIEVVEYPESDGSQTSRRKADSGPIKSALSSKVRKRRAKSHAETGTTVTEDVSDSESWVSGSDDVESDLTSSAPPKSLADIPFGYSAFSDLDLPLDANGRPIQSVRRPKGNRQASFKGATNVLKKAFTEGKKILADKAEPPKPAPLNRPPNIENWLKDTVDPFVDGPEKDESQPQTNSIEPEWASGSKTHNPVPPAPRKSADHSQPASREEDKEVDDTKAADEPHPEPLDKVETASPSGGLKRSRATRITSPPAKSNDKKGFKERLRDAFRGESSGYRPPPLEYSCYEERLESDDEHGDEYQERRRVSGTTRSTTPPEDDTSSISAGQSKSNSTPPCPRRRPPPTNGFHELSTIVSDGETLSTLDSDVTSMVSESTITGLTRNSAVHRKQSQKSGPKRRLTKHSDLISVLSLPEEPSKPSRSKSLRSARSVRRTSNHLRDATVDDLLREFAEDENLYSRELKTVVDGVIPVLLSQFVHGTRGSAVDLFEPPTGSQKEDVLSKAVVNMGVALEKLRNQHRRCPLLDVHRLPRWLDTLHSVYDRYLDVWRLGFQGIVVNLASSSPDDEDSLLNAMPRNEQGDVLNEDGDRIDVAHLLRRPLVRIKWITKFINGYRTVTGTTEHEALASKWEALQEKARRRSKEENARVVDDDAKNTDTSRARDLKTMEALDYVKIDRFRQVYAKDAFCLDFRHSNGQRLECQVELIFRDNQLFRSDPGDLLIRETGNGGRSWLLFSPVKGTHLSARKGDDRYQLILMIRGYKDEWSELMTLTADDEEQVLDWLDIFGSSPVPPAVKAAPSLESQPSVPSPKSAAADAPLGERRSNGGRTSSLASTKDLGDTGKPHTPSRYHKRNASLPATPISVPPSGASTPSSERTPTQDNYNGSRRPLPDTPSRDGPQGHARSFSETTRPEPPKINQPTPTTSSHREDGAPPPPAHRELGAKKPHTLAPPADNCSSLKRRTSSPLKHEYYPSDVSSESSFSSSGSDEDSFTDESSDDELEAADMPDTAPAISIKKKTEATTESIVTDSVVSVTPSASASQAGVPKIIGKTPEYLFKSMATISYWDNKHGCWKDLWPDVCSIVTTPGLVEAYPFRRMYTSSGGPTQEEDRPLIAMDLTPLVMLRNSTALDLEIRSPVLSYARLFPKVTKVDSSFFRFRAPSIQECEGLYLAVHRARMDNAKYKALEEETRIRAFGQNQGGAHHQAGGEDNDSNNHHQRRSWFGRKNSYRASARAPSQSAGSASPSSISASSFLKRLVGGGAGQFNIAMSSVDRQSARFGGGGGGWVNNSRAASLYTSSSGSAASPRSPSVSAANSGGSAPRVGLTTNNLKIRLHLLVSASKWEDHGNCYVEVTRPDQGTRQNLRKYQGMEKRIVVSSIPRKDAKSMSSSTPTTTREEESPSSSAAVNATGTGTGAAAPVVKLDVVLGSRCFSRLGSRGILLNVWEEVRDERGEAGQVPKFGGTSGGNVSKWCFQCGSVAESNWIFGLVTQEVVIA
ncbi:hypothetical protein GGR56DRAFT_658156 [Xylariaceae sp. FL0804]|nr:hypothetical protein GGR56DRAFT_658156 [Xylariaceae sp. FL0804]